MTTPTRSVVVTLIALASILVGPAVATACRITNASPWSHPGATVPGVDVAVWFDCGHSCGNYFDIDPGAHVNSPGNSGYVQACSYAGDDDENWTGSADQWNRETGSRISVESDGEARVKFKAYPDFKGPTHEAGYDNTQFHWQTYYGNDSEAHSADHGSYQRDVRSGDFSPCWAGSP